MTQAESRTVRGRVEGRVQGVAYRASMQREARQTGVRGWVRNTPDGCVDFVVHGKPELVRQLLDWARRGPPGSRVDRLEVQEAEADADLDDFQVRY